MGFAPGSGGAEASETRITMLQSAAWIRWFLVGALLSVWAVPVVVLADVGDSPHPNLSKRERGFLNGVLAGMELLARETRCVGGDAVLPHSLDDSLSNPRPLLWVRDAWRDDDRALNDQLHLRVLRQLQAVSGTNTPLR
jgi:hypothetical protein